MNVSTGELSRLVTAACVAIAVGMSGCAARPDVAAVGSKNVQPVNPSRVAGEFVQAGTVFRVHLDQEIDTARDSRGVPFTATVESPVVTAHGLVVVAPGAKLRGHVASRGTLDVRHVRIDLDSIDTIYGSAPIAADLRDVDHYAYLGPLDATVAAGPPYASDYIYPYAFDRYGSALPTFSPGPGGSSEPTYGIAIRRPRVIRIPAGAAMNVVLTRPVLVPGSFVLPKEDGK
jgi:hypothetical protein